MDFDKEHPSVYKQTLYKQTFLTIQTCKLPNYSEWMIILTKVYGNLWYKGYSTKHNIITKSKTLQHDMQICEIKQTISNIFTMDMILLKTFTRSDVEIPSYLKLKIIIIIIKTLRYLRFSRMSKVYKTSSENWNNLQTLLTSIYPYTWHPSLACSLNESFQCSRLH